MPARQYSAFARRVAAGDLSARLHPRGHDELAALVPGDALVSGEVIGSLLVLHAEPLDDSEHRAIKDSVTQSAPVIANLRTIAIAEQRAATDALTGMPNSRAARDTLKRMVAQATRSGNPLAVAEKIRAMIAQTLVTGVERPITASFGVSAFPEHALDADALMRSADRALYTSKREGRNRVTAPTMPLGAALGDAGVGVVAAEAALIATPPG
jgi:GGDEF domain-containing protein